MNPPKIDLAKALPKLRAAFDAGQLQCQQAGFEPRITSCFYDGPCAVGVMLEPDERAYLDREHENTSVGTLLFNDDLDAPIEQHNDLAELQGAHDLGEIDHLGRLLTRLEEKYA